MLSNIIKTKRSLAVQVQTNSSTLRIKNLMVFIGSFFLLASASAQMQKVDSIFLVSNAYSSRYASIAVNSTGDYVITWENYDGDGNSIAAQRYDASGQSIGDVISVSDISRRADRPDIAMNKDGSFVIVWENKTSSSVSDIYARQFDAQGKAIGEPIKVNNRTSDSELKPVVALADDGSFVVAWQGLVTTPKEIHYDVFAKKIDANGNLIGIDFQVNDGSLYPTDDLQPDIAMDAQGNFVIGWSRDQTYGRSILIRRFDSYFNRLGTVQNIRGGNISLSASLASLAMDRASGDYVIAWAETIVFSEDEQTNHIMAKRYNSSGSQEGDMFQVNTSSVYKQFKPSVAIGGNGETFAIAWTGWKEKISGDTSHTIFAQRFMRSTGDSLGDEIKVSSEDQTEINPTIGLSQANDMILGWSRRNEYSSYLYSVYATRYEVSLAPTFVTIPDQTIEENSRLELDITVQDANSNEAFKYTLDNSSEDLGIVIEDKDDAVQLIWVPNTQQAGEYEVRLMVEDKALLSDEISFKILVKDVQEEPEILAIGTPANTLFSVFPNPTKSTLQLVTREKYAIENYVISDLSGQELLAGSISGLSPEISVTFLTLGTYILTVSGPNWKQSQRFVKKD